MSAALIEKNTRQCPKCTFLNTKDKSRCEICNHEFIKLNSAVEWECKRCTFVNVKNDRECKVCGKVGRTVANIVDKNENKPKSGWSCEVCSYSNVETSRECEVCCTPKEKPTKAQFDRTISVDNEQDLVTSLGEYYNTAMNTALINGTSRANYTIHEYQCATDEAESVWRNIVKYCKRHKHKFVDDSFPPCDKSLFVNPSVKPDKLANKVIQWKSLDEIKTSYQEAGLKWTVYNEPRFDDIKQGFLGDCWLLSSLAVIVEKPEILQKIIITKEFCPQGCYQVRLCKNGQWETVILDDLFPCDENGYLMYSQASRKQLWVPLIEKALAKLNGSYESLISGLTVEGLSTLTGFPCVTIRMEKYSSTDDEIDLEMIWVRLLSMKEAGYIMGASCGRLDMQDEQVYENCGLMSRHAYSLLDVKEALGNHLIQLRNPWGRHTWTGDWSQDSTKWTPEIKKALKIKNRQEATKIQDRTNTNDNKEDEGVFWMSFDDFSKFFSSIDICKSRSDWFENRTSGEFAHEASTEIKTYRMLLFDTCEINIGLHHKSQKNRTQSSELDLGFAVFKSSANSLGKFVTASKRAVKKFVGIEHIFEPGEYLIVPFSFNFWHTNQRDNNYNFTVHSTKMFFIEQETHPIALLTDTIIELCVNLGSRTETQTVLENSCLYSLSTNQSGLIVVAENKNKTSFLHVELNCKESRNLLSTRKDLLTRDSVPPGNRQILMLLTKMSNVNSYNINLSMKFRGTTSRDLNRWPGCENLNATNMPDVSEQIFQLHWLRSTDPRTSKSKATKFHF